MKKLKPISAEKVIKALTKIGFSVIRQRGSHVIMKHPDGRVTVIPVHPGEEIGRGLLMKIIKEIGITKEEFLKLLEDT